MYSVYGQEINKGKGYGYSPFIGTAAINKQPRLQKSGTNGEPLSFCGRHVSLESRPFLLASLYSTFHPSPN